MTQKILKVKNGEIPEAVQEFLKDLLKEKKVSALLVMQPMPSKKTAFPVLISDPHHLHANVFSPVLPVSTAKLVSKMTKIQPAKQPIGVVMHPCQICALIELAKLNQANLENLIIIGVDCLGTFSLNTYTDFPEKKKRTTYLLDAYTQKTKDAEKYLRTACLVCKDPIPTNADIVIGLHGMDIGNELLIEAHTDAGKKLLEGLNLEPAKDIKEHREKAIKAYREEQAKRQEAFIKEKNVKIKGIKALTEFFDKCINCKNCMHACPICYCRECLYESSVFDAEAYKFLRKADVKGLVKMPNDTLLFHLGRMNHMILSCVECGLCEQACPSNIPLMEIFIPAAENAQQEFKYNPGKDSKEKIPMIVYREDEYKEVGEA